MSCPPLGGKLNVRSGTGHLFTHITPRLGLLGTGAKIPH